MGRTSKAKLTTTTRSTRTANVGKVARHQTARVEFRQASAVGFLQKVDARTAGETVRVPVQNFVRTGFTSTRRGGREGAVITSFGVARFTIGKRGTGGNAGFFLGEASSTGSLA